MTHTRTWLRRAGCLLAVLVWLLIMLFPTLAVIVARNGQVGLGPADGAHVRVFLVTAEDNNGVGLEWTGFRRGPDGACRQTSVGYLLWEGEGEPARYCTCRQPGGEVVTPACPP